MPECELEQLITITCDGGQGSFTMAPSASSLSLMRAHVVRAFVLAAPLLACVAGALPQPQPQVTIGGTTVLGSSQAFSQFPGVSVDFFGGRVTRFASLPGSRRTDAPSGCRNPVR